MPLIKKRRRSRRRSGTVSLFNLKLNLTPSPAAIKQETPRQVMAEFDGKMNRAVIVDEEDDPKMYLVHFEGWNARYDQWVDESRVKFNVPVQPKKEYETPNPIEKKSKLETSKKEDEKAETGSPQLSHQKSYEQQRLENIRRNQEMLRLLNLEGLAAGLRKPKKAKIVKKLKKTEKPSKPSRRL
eukprot:1365609-Amorphochlora_amoeboformis.AAC.2